MLKRLLIGSVAYLILVATEPWHESIVHIAGLVLVLLFVAGCGWVIWAGQPDMPDPRVRRPPRRRYDEDDYYPYRRASRPPATPGGRRFDWHDYEGD